MARREKRERGLCRGRHGFLDDSVLLLDSLNSGSARHWPSIFQNMIRKLKSGEYRLYSRKKNPSTGKRRNLGTFRSRAKAEEHERAVQFFKRH